MNKALEYETLLVNIKDNVAHITINRPDAANALNGQMGVDLFKVSIFCDENPDVRAVLLSSTGKIFCAGGDLKEFASHGEDLGSNLKELTVYFHAAMSRFARMDAPLIGAVHGIAGGAGMSIVCACDLVYAAETSRFVLAYTASGLTPDGSSTYYLPRLVGFRRAMELALTNRRLTAKEAMEWGVINRVVPEDELLHEAMETAKKLAAGPTLAFGATKRLLHSSWNESLETQMELEARAISDISKTTDAQEGIDAFLNKRKPEYKGA